MASPLEQKVESPPVRKDVDRPRSQDDVDRPRSQDVDRPRSQDDVDRPRSQDVDRPRSQDVGPLEQDVDEILLTEEQIQGRLAELAAEVDRDYADEDRLMLVGVLKGAFMVMADLARYLKLPVTMDFMACASYGSSTRSSGVVRILKDLDTPIEDRHVLVVEDVVDSGLTLGYLMKNLSSRSPASLEVLSLLTKPTQQRASVPIRYEGFQIPEVFVVGYGLDYSERYRNLPYIATLADHAYQDGLPADARPEHRGTAGR